MTTEAQLQLAMDYIAEVERLVEQHWLQDDVWIDALCAATEARQALGRLARPQAITQAGRSVIAVHVEKLGRTLVAEAKKHGPLRH